MKINSAVQRKLFQDVGARKEKKGKHVQYNRGARDEKKNEIPISIPIVDVRSSALYESQYRFGSPVMILTCEPSMPSVPYILLRVNPLYRVGS
jgi:hypothetical protein